MVIATAMITPLAAEPVQRLLVEEQRAYDVDGITVAERRKQLDQQRPERGLAQWHAHTEATLTTDMELESGELGCGFSLLEVRLEMTTCARQGAEP
jgi:predicted secreted Zn-dependent protease